MPVTRILHAAGNYRALHPLAEHPAVDAIEADVWVRSGRVVAHHERPLGAIPLMLHRRGLRPLRRNPVRLEELLEAVAGGASLVLDVRSWFGDPAPDVARELLAAPDRSHIFVTCESWGVADRLRAWLPDVHVAYSVRSERQLRTYVAGRLDGSTEVTGVAVRHTLLRSANEVESLRRLSGRVVAWTVDDVDRGLELVEWGLDGIVSNHLQVLNAV
jgi:glycerophosphoryl diester phosphodiesterase